MKAFPEFSWSYSRHKTLTDCVRKYGYEYYFSHNGWLFDSSPLNKHAYRLKKIVNLPILFGQAVHDVIESTIKHNIKTGAIPSTKELERRVRLSLRTAFLDSRDRKDLWLHKPSRYTMLFEMYYGGELPAAGVQEIHDRLDVCLKHFLHSKSFREMTSGGHIHFLESERFRTVEINGVKLYVVMDLLYRDLQRDKWVIVDWKTGSKSSDDVGQLAVYALYLMKEWNVPLEKIEIRNEYLLTGGCHTYHLTPGDIQAMLEQMDASVQYMNHYKLDTAKNEPVPLEEFQRTSHIFRCRRCNYKELCDTSTNND
ncbi:PD-(D/E)XK nuclease family protein [Bacillus songklensis]|uniref:PD-(D/E)XK nuclease family protein n=1 Tax=Bacillus songklensis TaxID=1069116 RepID=A0ABV8B873_9BACI